jgi:single-stranded DNA-binding protein
MSDTKKPTYQDNKLLFVGNVANAPTLKTVAVGGEPKQISEFRVINHRGDAMTTVTVKAWEALAPVAAALAVGTLVKIEGSLSIRRNKNEATGQVYTEVNLNAKSITTLATPKAKPATATAPAAEEALL